MEAHSPRRNGGADSPLVVVGNADHTGNRYESSNWVDKNNKGILTLYAPGVDILCAVKTATNAFAIEPPGTSQATAVTAGLMAYFLSDPVLHAQFTAGGPKNMPMRLKQYLIEVSTQQKGIGGWGDENTDNIPRLSNGENVECSENVVQGAPEVPAYVSPPQTATGKVLATSVVSEGMNVVLPAALRVSSPCCCWLCCVVRLLSWICSLPAITGNKSAEAGCIISVRRRVGEAVHVLCHRQLLNIAIVTTVQSTPELLQVVTEMCARVSTGSSGRQRSAPVECLAIPMRPCP
jgi:hypothetical protein